MTSQPDWQIITKGYQTMKYGQLIEYNMRNMHHKNHTQNAVGKQFPDPFIKHQNWASLDQ